MGRVKPGRERVLRFPQLLFGAAGAAEATGQAQVPGHALLPRGVAQRTASFDIGFDVGFLGRLRLMDSRPF
jgi:hypothetical protein